jgi:hypothetical protein
MFIKKLQSSFKKLQCFRKLQSGFYIGFWLINFQKQGNIWALRFCNKNIFLRLGNQFEFFNKYRFCVIDQRIVKVE